MVTTIQTAEKERVKQIVAEIVRQAGGVLLNKTRLAEAFWRAHLIFAESQPGYLSFWPILKGEDGPVIDQIDTILGELVVERALQIEPVRSADLQAFRFRITDQPTPGEPVSPEAAAAIEQAVACIQRDELPSASSHGWREAAAGEEINIYLDLIPEHEYEARKAKTQRLASALDSLWD